MWLLKSNIATNARSMQVKVQPRRPISGGSISDPVQLSPTPISDPVQLFHNLAQLYPHEQLYCIQLSTGQLPAVQDTYVYYVLLIRTCCTLVLHIAVARPLPLLPPLLPLPRQQMHKRPLLYLIVPLPQLYRCASIPSSFSNTSFLSIASYFYL